MAKILGKDDDVYAKEREGFLRDLQHFHEAKGTPFRRFPQVNGQEIDLYLLYSLVTAQGGWLKVNSKNSWGELFEKFNLTGKCVNASVALKQVYLRYLDRWEKVHYLGEEADRGSDDDEESRHKRWSARALHSVPLTYNHSQHNVAESSREFNHLSTNVYKASDYDRLALSLISPLPNEQDFAINVCTLLSNDGKHTLKLEKYPRIVNYLLAHAGVFQHSSLRRLFVHVYTNVRKHSIHNFWRDAIEYSEFLELTDETKFLPPKPVKKEESPVKEENPVLKVCEEPIKVNENVVETVDISDDSDDLFASDSDSPPRFKFKRDVTDRELFCLGRSLGTQDYIGQRVLQVATILRNLSFIEENVPVLVKNETFVRFFLLCASSQWSQLRNLGLDMLGNVATDFLVRDLPADRLAVYLLKIVTYGLQSEDRACCISSLEVLNKLSQNVANEDAMLRNLESSIYEKVCSFLTLHDVMLLIYTLECLYSLSSLGERSCNLIVNNHGVVDTLVSLVTVEGKSYGPKACIGMKLVETVPGGSSSSSSSTSGSTAPPASTSQATSATTTATINTSVPITPIAATPVQSSSIKPLTPATPSRPMQIQPQRLIAISPAPVTTPTVAIPSPQVATQVVSPQQLVQQQHAHQQAIQENEQFALAWLRATYEPCSSGRVDHQELYKQYINSCAKIGRRGVIAPLHFPRCVRSVFGGTVGPNPVKPQNPNDPQYYDGIKPRAQPLVISIQSNTNTNAQPQPKGVKRKASTGSVSPAVTTTLTVIADNQDVPLASPASPILKAQLSAPPKQREGGAPATPCTKSGDMKSQVMAHPHLSQALLGNGSSPTAGTSKDQQAGQSNTSLIKSLLATKVNNCMTTVSMKTATDCQNVAQVAARQQQQRLMAQQTTTPDTKTGIIKVETPKSAMSRLNGARQLFTEDSGDSSVSSTTPMVVKGKKEPPQPPPPPLAPLSNQSKSKPVRIDNEDSDSTGNNSLASSNIGLGGISSTEDGDNSLTSFEGLLNGVPNVDNPISVNEDSNSKEDSVKGVQILKNKPLMLADLLEKKIEKELPLLNGAINKELRIGDKGLELVENHIEKALSGTRCESEEVDVKQGVKRCATEDIAETETKKPLLAANVNGNSGVDSPAPESVASSNGDEAPATVSTAAAKLFADIAADILEDEDEEELMQQQRQPRAEETQVVHNPVQQIIVDNNQQMLVTQQRQLIVSQPQNQVVIPAATQIKPQGTVIVQNSNQQRAQPMVLQQNTGQILLSQGGQVQLLTSTTQPGQYVLQTGGAQGAYVVAQPQTAVVHGQPQTVLVAQTPQQQGTAAKTIIILQQQPATSTAATHHQKVVVTPQGQQVVVTQVPRPIVQQPTVSSNVVVGGSGVIKTNVGGGPVAVVAQNNGASGNNGVVATTGANGPSGGEVKQEEAKPVVVKPKIIRDLTTPFVCEWGECNIQTKFKSANEVYLHVCEAHCPQGSEEITCQWDRCDNMKRKRFSLMTHLYDKHCNTEAMKASLTKRKQVSHSSKPETPPSTSATPHPGYAPDAAFHAIKRHALEFVNPKELQRPAKPGVVTIAAPAPRAGPPAVEQDDNEGPVTKSIRLTASLILRNLVIYSSNCRRYLKPYEPHLANVALSNVESSRTIAQVLYDMNEGSGHR